MERQTQIKREVRRDQQTKDRKRRQETEKG